MGTIRQLTARFQALDYEAIKQQSLIETAPQIIPEMTEQQQRKGQLSTGEQIHPLLRDKTYALLKLEAGGKAPSGVPDLRNSGAFQSGLRTVVTDKALKTYSLDVKAQKLELRYSAYIYGANSANLSIYAKENLYPVLIEKLKTATVG